MNIVYNMFVKIMDYFGRRHVIYDIIDNKPYLEIYYIFLKNRENFPFNIFLHRFLKSDPDDVRDHPLAFRTLILAGGYWEFTDEGKIWRGPLSYIYAPSNTFYRVELDKNIHYCWRLFIPSKSFKEWGFRTKDGWLKHDEYFIMRKNNYLKMKNI